MGNDFGRTLVDRLFHLVRFFSGFLLLRQIDFLFVADTFLFAVFDLGIGLVAFMLGGGGVLIGLLFGLLFGGLGFIEPGLEFRRRLGGFRALPRTKHSVQVL